MPFFQTPPTLPDLWASNAALRDFLRARIPDALWSRAETELSRMAALSGGELYALQQAATSGSKREPVLTSWDAWGNRIDEIKVSPLWDRAAEIAAEEGLVATGYDRSLGASARLLQFAKVYLFQPSSNVYSCPLAMTDGAAKTLLTSASKDLQDRTLPQLLSRDPKVMWTSGQWMTERTGGSDVGLSETVACKNSDGTYALSGTKWFTSATTSPMALTLARIVDEGSPEGRPGGSGLTLFFARVRKEDGLLNGISINRLKDKLGTRDVPTAELLLKDMIAEPVCGLGNGIKNISPMLTITRTWNAVCAAADLRRATDLAIDYANKRVAFGAPLSQKPLHRQTLATLEAESRAAMLLALRTAELLGIEETSTTASDELRLLTPLAKLGTGKQAIWGVSEAIESFGGAGYVEDTGLPRMLRDAQVYPIWEGTTNVLALDALRALGASDACLVALMNHARMCVQHAPEELARAVTSVLDGATAWLSDSEQKGREFLEAGARAFSLSLVRAYALALLLGEATRAEGAGGDTAGWGAAARVFARTRIDYFGTVADPGDAAELLDGQKATTYAGPR